MSSFIFTIFIMALLALCGRTTGDSSDKETGNFDVIGLLEKVLFFPLDIDMIPVCKETECYNLITEKEVSIEHGCKHGSIADINIIKHSIHYLEELKDACTRLFQYSADTRPSAGVLLVTAGVVLLVVISCKISALFKEKRTNTTVERLKMNKTKSKSTGLQMGDNRGVKREREPLLWTPQKKTKSYLCTQSNPSSCHSPMNTTPRQNFSPNAERMIREGQKANLDALLRVKPQKEYISDHSRDASGLDSSLGSGDSSFLANVENRIKEPSHVLDSSFEFNQEQSLDFDSSFENWEPFANSSFVEVEESCEDCQRKLDYFLGPSNPCVYHAKRLSKQRFTNGSHTSGTVDETDMSVRTSTDEYKSAAQSSLISPNRLSSVKEKLWNTVNGIKYIVQTPLRYISRSVENNETTSALRVQSADRIKKSSTLERPLNTSLLLRNSFSDLSSSLSDMLDMLE